MKNYRTISAALLLTAAMTVSLASCATIVSGADSETAKAGDASASAAVTQEITSITDIEKVEITAADAGSLTEWSEENGSVTLALTGSENVSITEGGTYILSGKLDGSVIIEADKNAEVQLVLNGVDISCPDSAPIYAKRAKSVTITLADGSVNKITDGETYTFAEGEDEPSGAIFSKCDLIIEGGGSLYVAGNYNNGIQSKDTLVITGGSVTVASVGDGIKGKDSVAIENAEININAGSDGIQSSNADDAALGYIVIESGKLNITAAGDGIQAESSLTINGGEINVVTGGGAANAPVKSGDEMGMGGHGFFGGSTATTETESTVSSKGLKAETALNIAGGSVKVDSYDDSLHAGGDITVTGGTLTISSGDDGIHSDANVNIKDGAIDILTSYEGIEGVNITVDGGEIALIASDDGFNASSGSTTTTGTDTFGGKANGGFGGRGGGGGFGAATDTQIYINGGKITVNADGDGIDSNGNIYMTGGEVYVSGPTNSGNGAIDYAGSFEISGGSIIAVGASGMAESATAGEQCAALITVSQQSGGQELTLKDASGNVIISFTPEKSYNSVMLSASEMKVGGSYTLTVGQTVIASFDQTSTRITTR